MERAKLITAFEEILSELKSTNVEICPDKLKRTLTEIIEEATGYFPVISLHRDDLDVKTKIDNDTMRNIRKDVSNAIMSNDYWDMVRESVDNNIEAESEKEEVLVYAEVGELIYCDNCDMYILKDKGDDCCPHCHGEDYEWHSAYQYQSNITVERLKEDGFDCFTPLERG